MAYEGNVAINHAPSEQRQVTKGIWARSLRMNKSSLREKDNPEKNKEYVKEYSYETAWSRVQ